MLDTALKFLQIFNDSGFQAYIVGGFVRDYILGIESNDIDITTDATPRDIINLFEDCCLPNEEYGSVTVVKWGVRFEITTFREEISYVNNRRPTEIKYIKDLYKDLIRRDFTINSICMDRDGKIIDLLNGRDDIKNKIISTIGNADERFEEDCLRILRAIRFATVLDFRLDKDVADAIRKKKYLLKSLSYFRKKEELDKIFSSGNYKRGLRLLSDFGLDEELELNNLKLASKADNIIGIWSVLDVSERYPFTSNEKELIGSVKKTLNKDNLDPLILYKYGLYVNCISGEINGISKKRITKMYNDLPIHSKKDILVTSEDIMHELNRKPGSYLKDIYEDLEQAILYKKVKNDKRVILEYLRSRYI